MSVFCLLRLPALTQPTFLFPVDMLENDIEMRSLPFALCDRPQLLLWNTWRVFLSMLYFLKDCLFDECCTFLVLHARKIPIKITNVLFIFT